MEQGSFSTLPLSPEILRAVGDLNFTEMTQIQEKAIPKMLEGCDLIGRSSTGTGKTAAFGLPAIQSIDPSAEGVQVLVMLPTRELALQVCDELRKFAKYKEGVRVVPVYGGANIATQITQLKGAKIVVGTPGRIKDHLSRRTLKLGTVRLVVLDEADEMLNMGFLDDMKTILRQTPDTRQTVLFSATMPGPILRLTERFQKNPIMIEGDDGQTAFDLIKQYYCDIPARKKISAVLRLFEMQNITRALIFCNTKHMVDVLTDKLVKRGMLVSALHGDMRQSARTAIMKEFKAGNVNVLIATDVAARGIDASGVEAIINYDFPQNPEYYTHRIGRTGRAGNAGAAYSLVAGHGDFFELANIEEATGVALEPFEITDLESTEEDGLGRAREKSPRRDDGSPRPPRAQQERKSVRAHPAKQAPSVTVTLDIGSDHDITATHIVNALADSGADRRGIGDITIGAETTTVELPGDFAKKLLLGQPVIANGFLVEVTGDGAKPEQPAAEAPKKRRRRKPSGKKAATTPSETPAE
ncbi:MAG: hypothetical protein ABT01_06590 [Clostridium sp. SCN 57-10]|nr:MAG: hypothetical protein ABT01_06590 [Clostridium sp. SCN 57-10]